MTIDRAISEHILLALRDLEASGKPLMGKRNITLFLQGKVNANSLELELHLQPGWGTLPFISIRKLQSILEGMIEVGIIEIYESPKKDSQYFVHPKIPLLRNSLYRMYSL